jgi:DNA-binding NarL/FixJ family response regulator
VRELVNRLTPREKEVLGCMAKGLSSRAIGAHLSISPRTVEVHRAHLLSKMQASNSPDAVRIALKAGLEIR